MSNNIVTLPELASYLSMSQASLYHLVADGKIPGTKVGKQWRFSLAAVDDWMKRSGKAKLAVLAVDDDPMIRNLMVERIGQDGHSVMGAQSVAEAKKLLQEFEFDLVLLDLLLGDGTGLDLVRTTSQLTTRPSVIMITGHPEHDLVNEIRGIVPDVTVFRKPFRLNTLVEHVSRVARERRE